jgi:hypothetical protein
MSWNRKDSFKKVYQHGEPQLFWWIKEMDARECVEIIEISTI